MKYIQWFPLNNITTWSQWPQVAPYQVTWLTVEYNVQWVWWEAVWRMFTIGLTLFCAFQRLGPGYPHHLTCAGRQPHIVLYTGALYARAHPAVRWSLCALLLLKERWLHGEITRSRAGKQFPTPCSEHWAAQVNHRWSSPVVFSLNCRA